MLFVSNITWDVVFWMKNTLIPLDIVFIKEDSKVANVEQADVEIGVPDNELKRYQSNGPVKCVVEINQGLCSSYNISTGTLVIITYQSKNI